MECYKISNQRCCYYFPVSGVSEHDLFMLWVSLSEKGYYKISSYNVNINFIKDIFGTYFNSLEDFKKSKGL